MIMTYQHLLMRDSISGGADTKRRCKVRMLRFPALICIRKCTSYVVYVQSSHHATLSVLAYALACIKSRACRTFRSCIFLSCVVNGNISRATLLRTDRWDSTKISTTRIGDRFPQYPLQCCCVRVLTQRACRFTEL